MRHTIRYPCIKLHQLSGSVGSQKRLSISCFKLTGLLVNKSSTNSLTNIQRHLTIIRVAVNCFNTRTVPLSNNFQAEVLKFHHFRENLLPSRSLHSHNTNSSYQIKQNNAERLLEITSGSLKLRVPFIWLRDHCRSEKYYNHKTFQKNVDFDLLNKDLTPARVDYLADNLGVAITWKDEHVSEFTFEFLLDNFYPGRSCHKTERLLWNRAVIESHGLPEVSFDHHVGLESGLKQSLVNLVKYGFTFVQGAPVSVEGTQEVAERVAPVFKTIFGKMWVFTADGSHNDTAYSTQHLGAHTDNTYLTSPAGIQVFQCFEHNGAGGETLLVDGFSALELLRTSDPTAFRLLCQTVIPHEYIESPSEVSPGYHLYTLGTVISTHPATGELLQIRYNPYDRAPLNTVRPDDVQAFYEAYSKLSGVIADPSNELWVKLKPGSVLLIDNWRVMHGRAAFEGRRIMGGCYLPRDEWLSKARLLAVL
ncbi:unnamed protein product [Candidula unifasciata]|uniref:Trimethyllysine dioxygenase, mitochondrial n=1 Tax=Candidula unifasciata TaxID=100452 RepID=A0A8S3YGP6_9EUPU|nr:unnamed protein product [Candidula unifasciata]